MPGYWVSLAEMPVDIASGFEYLCYTYGRGEGDRETGYEGHAQAVAEAKAEITRLTGAQW
jgi:hypothetical protein